MPVTIESPEPATTSRPPDWARVAVVRTRPDAIVEDYGRSWSLPGVSRRCHGTQTRLDRPTLMLGIVP